MIKYIHKPDEAGKYVGKYHNLPFSGMSVGYEIKDAATADENADGTFLIRAVACYASAKEASGWTKDKAHKAISGRLLSQKKCIRVKEWYVVGATPKTVSEWRNLENSVFSRFVQ